MLGLLDLFWNNRSGQDWVDAARDPKVVKLIEDLAKTARSARQHNAVAAHRLFSGNVDAALASSAEAIRLRPDCWLCFHNRAAALFASGSAQQAIEAQREAINRLPETSGAAFVTGLSQALAFYERAARDPAAVADEPTPGLIAP